MPLLTQPEFDKRRYFAIMEYYRLKDDFVDFLRYVPLERENRRVYSPRLSSMITDVCEQIVDNLELWIQAPPLKFLLYGGYKDPTSEDEKAEFDKAREQFVDEMKRRKKLATAWATKNSSVS